ncbi:hypothetical protein Bca101_073269 [Brassica carinata]
MSELRGAYAGSVAPVPDYNGLPALESDFNGMRLYPPTTRRPPGRPKKQRELPAAGARVWDTTRPPARNPYRKLEKRVGGNLRRRTSCMAKRWVNDGTIITAYVKNQSCLYHLGSV